MREDFGCKVEKSGLRSAKLVGFFEGNMHGSIRDRLEDLLAARGAATRNGMVVDHLSNCAACSSELESMKAQSELLQSLRSPEELEPAPGFYARVLQRIEERAKDSIWAGFIYSPFAKRLVYTSLTIALVLGSYVIAQETRDGHLWAAPVVAQDFHYDPVVAGNQAQQRDAVLENFASHPVLENLASHQGSLQ